MTFFESPSGFTDMAQVRDATAADIIVFDGVKRAIAFLSAVQGTKIPGTSADYSDNTFADAALRAMK